tara:strand:- start:1121 stop:1840 length:720 start_codon:yes stop_codon:yes gene_type:complete
MAKIILYHGTDTDNLEKILKEGIKPRGTNKGNWAHAGLYSNNKLIYLTDTYAWYYAVNQANHDNKNCTVLQVEVDTDDLYCDEDLFMQASTKEKKEVFDEIVRLEKQRGNHIKTYWKKFKNWEGKRQHQFYSDYILHFKHLWKIGLDNLGTVAHLGIIKPEQIRKYDTQPVIDIFLSHDNSVTILNHMIRGPYLKAELKEWFDEPLDENDKKAIQSNLQEHQMRWEAHKEIQEKKINKA